MFYEEKWIDGALHYRGDPEGIWIPMSPYILNARLEKAERALRQAERETNGRLFLLAGQEPLREAVERAMRHEGR